MSWEVYRQENGMWLVNGAPCPNLGSCRDFDTGVTPATNTLPIRRLHLEVGASQELSAAWMRFPKSHGPSLSPALHAAFTQCVPLRIPGKRFRSHVARERTRDRSGLQRFVDQPFGRLGKVAASHVMLSRRLWSVRDDDNLAPVKIRGVDVWQSRSPENGAVQPGRPLCTCALEADD